MSILDRARAMRAKYITLAQNAPDELLSSGDYLSVFDSLCGDGSLLSLIHISEPTRRS